MIAAFVARTGGQNAVSGQFEGGDAKGARDRAHFDLVRRMVRADRIEGTFVLMSTKAVVINPTGHPIHSFLMS